jgi:hypothetical protein
MSKQFGRFVNLVLANGGTGLDLSKMRIRFMVSQNDADAPNTAEIRVYNLSNKTVKQAMKEYDSVVLDAGYEDNHAIIFRGTIKQFRRGKESNVDSFLDILAADNDIGYNFGMLNQTFAPGVTPREIIDACAKAMGCDVDPNVDKVIDGLQSTGGVILNPRGKVAFGLARVYMRNLATTLNSRWSIQNGQVTLIPLSGYLPGEAVKINSLTGMVGIPEATSEGIQVRVFINPQIRVGGAIQLNNGDITQSQIRDRFFPGYKSQTFIASTAEGDGFYRVLVAEHKGDTRDLNWYTDLVCLNLDPSADSNNAVLPFG